MSQQSRAPQPAVTAVVARYAEMAHARRAFNALQNHGVDGSDIRLAGHEAQASKRRAEAPGAFEDFDERLVRHVGPRVALGAAAGGLLGVALGLVGAAVIAAIIEVDAALALFVLTMLIFAGIGAALGAFITFERTVGYDDTWELTLDETTDHGVWIVVRVRGDGDGSQIVKALERHAPPASVEMRQATPEGTHTVRW